MNIYIYVYVSTISTFPQPNPCLTFEIVMVNSSFCSVKSQKINPFFFSEKITVFLPKVVPPNVAELVQLTPISLWSYLEPWYSRGFSGLGAPTLYDKSSLNRNAPIHYRQVSPKWGFPWAWGYPQSSSILIGISTINHHRCWGIPPFLGTLQCIWGIGSNPAKLPSPFASQRKRCAPGRTSAAYRCNLAVKESRVEKL